MTSEQLIDLVKRHHSVQASLTVQAALTTASEKLMAELRLNHTSNSVLDIYEALRRREMLDGFAHLNIRPQQPRYTSPIHSDWPSMWTQTGPGSR